MMICEPFTTQQQNGNTIIDCTCPVVKRLQQRIAETYNAHKHDNPQPQIAIFGKRGHAEVIGLQGQTNNTAVIIEHLSDAEQLDYSRPIYLFSQTTKSLDEFNQLVEHIKGKISGLGFQKSNFVYYDTICRSVANRVEQLKAFAREQDLVLFVGGTKSSNAAVLFNHCKQANEHCFFITGQQDITMEYKINTVGVLTSGGDSPGMNAAIRAVVRSCIAQGIKAKGIYRGYQGLIDDEVRELSSQDVSGIIQRGGTILKSARCMEFKTPEGRKKAFETLQKEQIDALVVIGGDGTFTGARLLAQEYNVPVIGLPGTIDNDLWGTDSTIGYDTSLNTIMDCVDKLRDTATSHERVFLVEVMGRDAGFLTLSAAIASGAEAAIIPERATVHEQLEEAIGQGRRKSKNSSIVLVQEHAIEGGAQAVAKVLEEDHPEYNTRVTILGHLQRGGSPTAYDRIIASRMGMAAVQALLEEQRSIMIGMKNDEIVYVPLSKAIREKKDVKPDKWAAMQVLSI